METGPQLIVGKPGIEPATPGLQGKWVFPLHQAAPGFNVCERARVCVFELNIPPKS